MYYFFENLPVVLGTIPMTFRQSSCALTSLWTKCFVLVDSIPGPSNANLLLKFDISERLLK